VAKVRPASLLITIMCILMTGACSSPVVEDNADATDLGPAEPIANVEVTEPATSDIDFSAYAVKYYPSGDNAIEESAVYEDERPFAVTGHGPTDFLPSEILRPSIYVTFSQPVVPLSMLGKPAYTSEILSIYPPIGGIYRWYGTRLLSFEAEDEVIPQREYTVSVNPSVLSLGGKEITGTTAFRFRTEPLAIERVYPGRDPSTKLWDVPPDAAADLTLLFSHPINADVASAYVSVLIEGEPSAFTFDRDVPDELEFPQAAMRSALVLRLLDEIPEDAQVAIVLHEGARSEADFVGRPDDQQISFKTISPFSFVSFTTESWNFPRGADVSSFPVFLEFTHPVDEESLIGAVRTRPEAEVPAGSISTWGNQAMIANLPFPPESTYSLIVSGRITDVHGRELGKDLEVKVKVPEAERYAYFPNTGSRILEAQSVHRVAFEYQNVFDGVWKIGRVEDPYRSFLPGELDPYDFSETPKNTRRFEVLELDPWLNEEGKGTVGVSWNFEEADKKGNRPSWAQADLQVQVTDLALTTRIASNRILVLVSELSTGLAVEGAEVAIMRGQDVKLRAETDETGLAVFELEQGDYNRYFQGLNEEWKDHVRIRAVRGLDRVEFVPDYGHNPYRSGVFDIASPLQVQRPRMETLLFTDRGLYRPGETLWFRGIDLDIYLGEYRAYEGPYTVELRESGNRGGKIADLRGKSSLSGGLYGSFRLPRGLEPGDYVVSYTRDDGQNHQISFQIAQYENLRFQVEIESDQVDRYQGDGLRLGVRASYLSGGDVADGPFQFYWSKEPATFEPPGSQWQGFRFGPLDRGRGYFLSVDEGTLDGTGNAVTEQQTTREGVPGNPYSYQLEARVLDAGQQEIAARRRVFVHPASFYIGARLSSKDNGAWSTFVPRGEEVIAVWHLVDPEGGVHRAPTDGLILEAGLYRIDWKIAQQAVDTDRDRYAMVEELEATQTIRADQPSGSVTFRPKRGGLYRIKLQTSDESSRPAVTDLEFYATGADWIPWGGDSTVIGLETDRELYVPGETATVLVKSPLPKGTYLVTVERAEILEEYLIDLDGSAQVIGIPVREDHVPVVYVSVASYSVRSGTQSFTYNSPDLEKPKAYYGVVPIHVDTRARRIEVDIETEGVTYLPGGKAEIVIQATHQGRAVSGAEVTFVAVDRGVVDLIDYHIPDPLDYFYSESRFPLGVRGGDTRSILIDPVTYEVRDLSGSDAEEGRGGATRSSFAPIAVFEPLVVTDRDGVARVSFTLPDSLTTYRCTAFVVAGGRFGLSEEDLRVQQPINVLPILPERVRVRDTITASVLVSNMDRSDHEVTIGVEPGLLGSDGETTKTVAVAPGEVREITFELHAEVPGETEIVFVSRSDVLNERLVERITIEKSVVGEIVTVAGRTFAADGGLAKASEGLVIPGDERVQNGRIEIEIGPTIKSGLKSALSYLIECPSGSLEQRASRIMPIVLFEEAINLPEIGDIKSFVESEFEYWAQSQRENGGFPFWPESGKRDSFYTTLRIAHILKIAADRGFAIPSAIDESRLVSYLTRLDEPDESNDYLMLYRMYVQALYGVPVRQTAAVYGDRSGSLDLASLGFLGLVYHELGQVAEATSILEEFVRHVRPGTRSVGLAPRGDALSTFYGNDLEQLALLLMLQAASGVDTELTDRVVGALLQRQKDGYWRNTASTNWVLLAFASLPDARDESTPSIDVTVNLDQLELVNATFQTGTDSAGFSSFLEDERFAATPKNEDLPLEFTSDGGTIYYTASLGYELPAETVGSRDEGFSIYTVLEDAKGTEHSRTGLTLGQTYRQRIVVSTSRRRKLVALSVPVPSGVVILDSTFSSAGSYELEADGLVGAESTSHSQSDPVERVFSNEVRYYFDEIVPGSVEVELLFRATSRGVYPTPPAEVESMYEPEVFGRSSGVLYIIR
jgi:alpha-2-macroglobulin